MKKVKYGLKFKILTGIIVLLTVCTAFSLIYSYQLFIEDKTSYIFESGLKKAENVSDQLNYSIDDLKTRTDFNSILIATPTINFAKLINNQSNYVVSGIIEMGNVKSTVTKHFENTKNATKIFNKFGISINDILNELSKKADSSTSPESISWFYNPKPDLKLLVYFSKNPVGNSIVFSVVDLSTLVEMFSKDKIYTTQILNLSNRSDLNKNLEWISKLDYKKSKKGAFATTLNHKEVLLSYVFVNKSILVISSIDKEEAFGITQYLILKTILFAGFLLGIAVVFGIYFSSSITFPIIKLTEKAERLASGEFGSDVRIKTSDEINILGNTFNFMSSEIQALLKNKENLIAQLEDYSKNLEKMVDQRTKELKEANDFMALMVNSLDQGLLVFDNELNCNPMFTKACEPIFGISPLNKTLTDVLNIHDESDVQALKQWATVTFNEMIPFESAITLGPQKKVTGTTYTDEDYKFVQINYYPMRNEEEKISNIVLIATDKTNEIQATEKAKEKESYVSMILKILNNKTQFESFIHEVDEIFSQFKNAYSYEEAKIEFDLCMMLFHTLNGGFGIYSLSALQVLARSYETEISDVKDNCPDILAFIKKNEENVANLKFEFDKFKIELDQLIGTKFAANQSFTEVSRDIILSLKPLVLSTKNQDLIDQYFENFVKVPVINYFKAYDDLCKTTAVKINKEFQGLTFHNEDLKIEAEPLQEFFNVLVHLFRNCLDHGIEDSYTRKEKNKSPNGHIDVSFNLLGSNLAVVIADDGAGIDPAKIKARYNQLRPDEDISKLNNQEIIMKIFDPFFSTRDEVSALSGRGVGMSAIKEVVDRLNGSLEVESHVGHGSTFSFIIPI